MVDLVKTKEIAVSSCTGCYYYKDGMSEDCPRENGNYICFVENIIWTERNKTPAQAMIENEEYQLKMLEVELGSVKKAHEQRVKELLFMIWAKRGQINALRLLRR